MKDIDKSGVRRSVQEEQDGKEERTRPRNESRLRGQAERGGAGQCTSHSRVRDLAGDLRLSRACICASLRNERNAVATSVSRNPSADGSARDSGWDHRFFGISAIGGDDRGHIAAAAAAA